MRKLVPIALALVVLALVGVGVWAALQQREPVYRGKRLSGWLSARDNGSGSERAEADEAIRTIGTNGVPFYGAWLGIENPDEQVRFAAAQALGRYGDLAREAVPALLKARADPEVNVRMAVGDALAHIDPDALAPKPSK